MNLASIDLNRLLVLHAVISERSVTRAAAALHVTPSAVSNALARLRATFDDPFLFAAGVASSSRRVRLRWHHSWPTPCRQWHASSRSSRTSSPPGRHGRLCWPAPTPNRFLRCRGSRRPFHESFRTRAFE